MSLNPERASDVSTKGWEVWAFEWEDAHVQTDEFDVKNIIHRSVNYVTVGILVKEDEGGITVSADLCEDGRVRVTNFIPRKMFLRKWKIGNLQQRRVRTKTTSAPATTSE